MDYKDLIPYQEVISEEDEEDEEIQDALATEEEKGLSALEIGLTLTAKQLQSAERYLETHDLTRAIREVYYFSRDDPDIDDSQPVGAVKFALVRNEKWLRYVKARTEEKALDATEVLAGLADIATTSLGDFLNDEMLETVGQPMVDLRKAKQLGKLGMLKRIRFLKEGGIEIELYDRMRALELIGKALGLFKDTEIQVDQYIIKVVRA